MYQLGDHTTFLLHKLYITNCIKAQAGSILHLKNNSYGVVNCVILVSNGHAVFIRQSTLLCLCRVNAVWGVQHVPTWSLTQSVVGFWGNLDTLQLFLQLALQWGQVQYTHTYTYMHVIHLYNSTWIESLSTPVHRRSGSELKVPTVPALCQGHVLRQWQTVILCV